MTAISAGVCPCKLICLIAVLQHSPLFNRRRFAPVVVLRFPTETAAGSSFPNGVGRALLTHAAHVSTFNSRLPRLNIALDIANTLTQGISWEAGLFLLLRLM